MSHIAVERNRRRQMNEHLKVLRALTPAFYVKRCDQASIIGGAIDFIRELHAVLDSLEAKKKRRLHAPPPGPVSFAGVSGSPTPSPRSLLTTTNCSPTSAGSVSSSSAVSPVNNNNSGDGAVKELAACCNKGREPRGIDRRRVARDFVGRI